jgi:hypothetical protein
VRQSLYEDLTLNFWLETYLKAFYSLPWFTPQVAVAASEGVADDLLLPAAGLAAHILGGGAS